MSSNIQEDTLKSEIHHEDNHNFKQNFVNDVKVLRKGIAMNPFLENKLKRVNNSKIHFPEKSVDIVRVMEKKGEQDVVSFITERLVSKAVSICEPITTNAYGMWNESPSKKEKVAYLP